MSLRTRIIINPAAGKGLENIAEGKFLQLVREKFPQAQILLTKKQGEATNFAKQAQSSGAQRIVVCGGDGTIREVVEGLGSSGDSQIQIAIVPIGTSNDIARNLGIPLNPEEALRIIQEQKVQPLTVDVGVANGKRFLSTASVGLDAEINRYALPLKPSFRKLKLPILAYVPAYFISVARHVFSRRSRYVVSVYVNGKYLYRRYPITIATVTNSPTYAKGFRVNPGALLNDGLLDLCLLKGIRNFLIPFAIPLYMLMLLSGKHAYSGNFSFHKLRELKILGRKAMPIQVDGEDMGEVEELHVKVLPKAISVLCPLREPAHSNKAAPSPPG